MSDTPWTEAEQRLLDARSRAVAAKTDDAPAGQRTLLLVVAGDVYAVPADAVRSVAEPRRLTPLPHAPATVAGLCFWGGEVVPVFRLGALLGRAPREAPDRPRVVFVGEGAEALGLLVDEVRDGGLCRAAEESLALPRAAGRYLRGATEDGTPFLDLTALCASEETIVNIAAAGPRGPGDAKEHRP